jgi:hypothetical protein
MKNIFSARSLPVLLTGALLLVTVRLSAQDDPFAEAASRPEPPSAESTEEKKESGDPSSGEPAPPIKDPTLLAILGTEPTTPLATINAIDMLLDYNRPDLAAGFVSKLLAENLGDAEWFELYRAAGPDKVLRPGLTRGLDQGPELARKMLDAAERHVNSAGYIDTLVNGLMVADTYQRSQALSDLRLLGDVGAAALIDQLVRPEREKDWPRIRDALTWFGKDAEGPLVAAWNSNSAKLRVEALQALGHFSSSESMLTLMGAFVSETDGSLNQNVASRSLIRQLGHAPDRDATSQTLYKSARDHLLGHSGPRSFREETRWWRWDPEQRKLTPSWLSKSTISRIRAFRCARDLSAAHPDREDYRRLYWLARLEAAKLAGGYESGLPSDVISGFGREVDPAFVNSVLAEALELELLPAAIAACELLGESRDRSLLAADNGRSSPLVRSLNTGSVQLTFAACNAIGKIDPQDTFAGNSHYIDSLVYLSRSAGTRYALAGHIRHDVAQTLATLASTAGYQSTSVTSAVDLVRIARSVPDVEVILLTDSLGEPGFAELLQELRSGPRTRLVPVLLLVGPESLEAAQQLASRYRNVLASPIPGDAVLMARQLDNLWQTIDHVDANESARIEFARVAQELLVRYSSEHDRYSFFDLNQYDVDLSQLLAFPGSAHQACKLLGRIGTAHAQANLVNTASNIQLPEPLRREAAESFARAVRVRGIMLDRRTIMQQYDRYNASAAESAETIAILGYVLDVIERRVK